jgi:hypothetical protein
MPSSSCCIKQQSTELFTRLSAIFCSHIGFERVCSWFRINAVCLARARREASN